MKNNGSYSKLGMVVYLWNVDQMIRYFKDADLNMGTAERKESSCFYL